MKPKKLDKKLSLSKKTVADLNHDVMRSIWGGKTMIDPTCHTDAACCPQPLPDLTNLTC